MLHLDLSFKIESECHICHSGIAHNMFVLQQIENQMYTQQAYQYTVYISIPDPRNFYVEHHSH